MKNISIKDLESISLGAAFLGSGGGGDPLYKKTMCESKMHNTGESVKLLDFTEIGEGVSFVSCFTMGSPIVGKEKLFDPFAILNKIDAIEEYFKIKIGGFFPGEIGGGNAFTAMLLSLETGKPLLDCDLLGRAFPDLDMSVAELDNPPAKAFVSDYSGNYAFLECRNAKILEKQARSICVTYGSTCAVCCTNVVNKQTKEDNLVLGSYTKAMEIGEKLIDYGIDKDLDKLVSSINCNLVVTGVITKISYHLLSGFTVGIVEVTNQQNERYEVVIKNEFLFVQHNGVNVATTPDIISIIDKDSGAVLGSDKVFFGARVHVVSLRSPNQWYTEAGLAKCGQDAFVDLLQKISSTKEEKV